MKTRFPVCFAVASLACCLMVHVARAGAATPPGSTGQCNDGSYSQAAEKKGACRGHQGVKVWYSDTGSGSQSHSKPSASSPAASTAAPPARSGAPASASMSGGSPGGSPAGAKGQCNDGSYSYDAMKKGACRGHKGVKAWFGQDAPGAQAQTASQAQMASSGTPATPRQPVQGAAPPAPAAVNQSRANAPAPTAQQRQGGGPGLVWVNTSTKVYHCMGDRYYGKTKEGTYMSESDARAKGIRPDAGKACSK